MFWPNWFIKQTIYSLNLSQCIVVYYLVWKRVQLIIFQHSNNTWNGPGNIFFFHLWISLWTILSGVPDRNNPIVFQCEPFRVETDIAQPGWDEMAAILRTNIQTHFFHDSCCILIQISQKFVPKNPINNKPALVHMMAWCQTGNKSLSEPMTAYFIDAYIHQSAFIHCRLVMPYGASTLVQVMACYLMSPSHHLNQCWLGIIDMHPVHFQRKSTIVHDIIVKIINEIYLFSILCTSAKDIELIS